jgi:hypothetical protein
VSAGGGDAGGGESGAADAGPDHAYRGNDDYGRAYTSIHAVQGAPHTDSAAWRAPVSVVAVRNSGIVAAAASQRKQQQQQQQLLHEQFGAVNPRPAGGLDPEARRGEVKPDSSIFSQVSYVLALAYFAYMAAEAALLSGVVAVLFCGISLNNFMRPLMSEQGVRGGVGVWVGVWWACYTAACVFPQS